MKRICVILVWQKELFLFHPWLLHDLTISPPIRICAINYISSVLAVVNRISNKIVIPLLLKTTFQLIFFIQKWSHLILQTIYSTWHSKQTTPKLISNHYCFSNSIILSGDSMNSKLSSLIFVSSFFSLKFTSSIIVKLSQKVKTKGKLESD